MMGDTALSYVGLVVDQGIEVENWDGGRLRVVELWGFVPHR